MAGIEEQNAMDVWMYTIRTGKISYSVLLKSLQWRGNNARSGMEYQGTHGHISETGMKKLVEMRTREHINTSIHVEEELTEERIDKIIEDDLQYENPSLAEKLRQSKDVWLRNYKIMDLLHVEGIKVKRLS